MAVVTFDGIELFAKDYHLLHDFFDFFCAAFIGQGMSRTVYDFRLDSQYVVKINRPGDGCVQFQNINEWETYLNIKHHHPSLAKFLAPIQNISSCGKIMLMRKTTPIQPKQRMPMKIPAFLADTKIQNWGVMDGRVVCHDYANCKIFSNVTQKMIVPQWWSDSYQNKMNLK